jgi:hypothetical protein
LSLRGGPPRPSAIKKSDLIETWPVAVISSGACYIGALPARHESFGHIPRSVTITCHQGVYRVKWRTVRI